jgi:hypothetical protein
MFIRTEDGRAWDFNTDFSIMDDGDFLDTVKQRIYMGKNVLDSGYSDHPFHTLTCSQDLEYSITIG